MFHPQSNQYWHQILHLIRQKTENDYIGVNSGILDQFAIGFGEVKKAILLDCNTLKYEMVPVELRDYDIVIMNTNKPRALTESKYNERFMTIIPLT